jgi:alpha-ribazole phosphatase
MKKTLLLLRHAKHAASESRSFIGSTDIELSAEGRHQADAMIPFLQEHQPERCLCSPLVRCRETISSFAGITKEIDVDLREADFGRWEGKSFEQIQEMDSDAVAQWANFDLNFSFPGGERLSDFCDRIDRVAESIAGCPENTILAVTHAGVIRALICRFLGLHPRQYLLFHVDYCSLAILDLFDGKGVLRALNCRPLGKEI